MPVYHIKEDPNGREGRWSQIGIAVQYDDEKGWNILFDVPLVISDGTRLSLRERKERD